MSQRFPGLIILDSHDAVNDAKVVDRGYIVNLKTQEGMHLAHQLPLRKNCMRLGYTPGQYDSYYTCDENALAQLGVKGKDWRFCKRCPAK